MAVNNSGFTFEDEELGDAMVWHEEEETLFEEAIKNIERLSHFCQNCWRYDFACFWSSMTEHIY
jgi:hypothetical protein